VKQIICSKSSTKWRIKTHQNLQKKKERSLSNLKILKKISSNILKIIFEYLHEPDEFKNFMKFLHQIYDIQLKKKLNALPQKLTKQFLSHRFYMMTQKTDLSDTHQNIIEYFYSKNSNGRFDPSFPIFQILVLTLPQKKGTFTLILYKDGNLEHECSNNLIKFIPGSFSVPANWNKNIFSMNIVGALDIISIFNKHLNIVININVDQKQPHIVQFYVMNLNFILEKRFRAPLYLGFSDIRLFQNCKLCAKKYNWNHKNKHLISIEKLELILPKNTSPCYPDEIFNNEKILETYKTIFKTERKFIKKQNSPTIICFSQNI